MSAGLDALDPVIHAPKRLAAMAILVNSKAADFGFLRGHLGVSDSDLSKQMAALEKAGYVTATKTGRGRGGSTWYRATPEGAAAFRRHMAALDAIARLTAEPAGAEAPGAAS
ncbi:MAG TPA: transcriptional regulator [Acidimicrobiales bacterium]